MSKNVGLGVLLEVEILKKCTPLWREARLEVKSVKNSEAFFDVSDVVVSTDRWIQKKFVKLSEVS